MRATTAVVMGWVPEGAGVGHRRSSEGIGGRRRSSNPFPTKMTGAALRHDLQGCWCCWCRERSMTKTKPTASWKPVEPSTLTRGLVEALPQMMLTQQLLQQAMPLVQTRVGSLRWVSCNVSVKVRHGEQD
jgi:hypothetical protein